MAETAVDFTFAEVQIVKHLTESGPGSFFPSFPILKVLTQTMLGISSILKEPLGISYLEWQETIFVANIIPVSFSMLEQQRIKRARKKSSWNEIIRDKSAVFWEFVK